MVKIVLTGPESTGKTTLATALGKSLTRAVVVPEFARIYLEAQGAAYTFSDVMLMATGQQVWEQWYAQQNLDYLICDTDHVVFSIWAQEKYGFEPPFVSAWRTEAHVAQLYLLCTPDICWTDDPLREHPHDRDRLFQLYQAHLEKHGLPYQMISGAGEKRNAMALSAVNAIPFL